MSKTDGMARLRWQSGAAAALVVAAIVLAGCAAPGPAADRPPEAVVTERAKARWDALLAGRIDEAETYYAPAHRSGAELDSLRARSGTARVQWRDVEFREIECGKSLCRPVFVVRYDYRSPLPRVGTVESATLIEERWIQEGGDWYFVPSDGASEGLR